ncbi:MAG: hypothetical protein HQK63_04030 [Desulfamplus sp.]|nr:hypothetical protein [Desulfamplus sp.]
MITANLKHSMELEQTILKETNGLSWNSLQTVLDFIRFLKSRDQNSITCKNDLTDQTIEKELSVLETTSLIHLEEEFADYKKIYPKEI